MSTKIKESPKISPEVDVLEIEQEESQIVIFNDDVNTFDHVIETLVEVCGHTALQAEQCAMITHYKGKCSVKRGTFEVLVPMREAICDRGIWAEIM
jgi:ATP-dependent Clp protease adaptor protein ClpS